MFNIIDIIAIEKYDLLINGSVRIGTRMVKRDCEKVHCSEFCNVACIGLVEGKLYSCLSNMSTLRDCQSQECISQNKET